jgi:hypothetical protein
MRSVLLGLGCLLGVAACGSDGMDCGTPADIHGSWTYTGTQNAPAATMTGTMALTQPGTCTVAGSLAITVDNGSGTPTDLSGPISGLFLDPTTVDLTADLGGERRHIGTVVADTISGTWAMTGAGGGLSGTFRAVRGTP